MKNVKNTLLLLLVFLVSISISACGESDGDSKDKNNNNPPTTVTAPTEQEVLESAYKNFIEKNIEEATDWVGHLKSQSNAYCGITSDADKKAYKVNLEGKDRVGKDTLRVPWIELNEYATNRLRMFAYKKFQEDSFEALNNGNFDSAKVDALIASSNPIDEAALKKDNVNGLMPLAYVLYHKVKDGDEYNAKQCEFIKASVLFLNTKIEELAQKWDTEKLTFVASGAKGVEEMLNGIATVMINVDTDELANPAKLNLDGTDNLSATGSFRAVDSHMTGWLASQSIYRGPQGLYVGNYKNVDWGTKSLQAYVKAKKAAVDTAITADFADVDKYLGKNGTLVRKEVAKDKYEYIDFANLNTDQKEDLKKAIVAVKKLSDDFKSAAALAK